MECYKKCPLKKRPINYNIDAVEEGPENLSTKPEDLSIKRRLCEDGEVIDTKRFRYSSSDDRACYYMSPLAWNNSEIDQRSVSPSTDSCTSGDYFRETSVSPPASNPSYQNIHSRVHTQKTEYLCVQTENNWSFPGHRLSDGYAISPYPFQDPSEPQDLSMKSFIPLPALLHDFGNEKLNSQEKAKLHPRFNCQSCGKSYTTFSGLSKHQQFHCPAAECNQIKRFFNCEHCDKSYTTSGALKMHIRTHTLPCKCPTCGKAFSRPWLLQGHIRTHTGEKPFKCQYCARAFADRSNLRAHLQTHAEVKKYVCTICNKSFSRMSLLTKHNEGGCALGITARGASAAMFFLS